MQSPGGGGYGPPEERELDEEEVIKDGHIPPHKKRRTSDMKHVERGSVHAYKMLQESA